MKKAIALILALVMVLGIVGCGGSTKEPAPTATPNTINNGVIQPKIEVEYVTVDNGEKKKTDDVIEFEEPIVIVDNEFCVISIISKYITQLQVGYKALVENKTDMTISISFDDVSVDGFMNIVGNYDTTITAGNKGYVAFAVVRADRTDVSSCSPNVSTMDDLKNVKGTMKIYSKDGSKLTKLCVLDVTVD